MPYIPSTEPRPTFDKDDNKKNNGRGDKDIVTVNTAPESDPAAAINLATVGY